MGRRPRACSVRDQSRSSRSTLPIRPVPPRVEAPSRRGTSASARPGALDQASGGAPGAASSSRPTGEPALSERRVQDVVGGERFPPAAAAEPATGRAGDALRGPLAARLSAARGGARVEGRLVGDIGRVPRDPELDFMRELMGMDDVEGALPVPGSLPLQVGTVRVPVVLEGRRLEVKVEMTASFVEDLEHADRTMRFLPERGELIEVTVDGDSEPPREQVVARHPILVGQARNFLLDTGEAPPPFVHRDEETGSYRVLERVVLEGRGPGRWSYSGEVGPPLGAGAAGRRPSSLSDEQRVLRDAHATPEALAAAMKALEEGVRDDAAKVVFRAPMEGGINGIFLVRLDNGAFGVWKPAGEEYRGQIKPHVEAGGQGQRDAFAYEVSKRLGHLGRVPPAVWRTVDGEAGVLIAAIPRVEVAAETPRGHALRLDRDGAAYADFAVLDGVLGNLDRNLKNVLFAGEVPIAIDHGVSMPVAHGDQGTITYAFDDVVALAPRHLEPLRALVARWDEVAEIGARLGLSDAALARMKERVTTMIATKTTDAAWRHGPAPGPADAP